MKNPNSAETHHTHTVSALTVPFSMYSECLLPVEKLCIQRWRKFSSALGGHLIRNNFQLVLRTSTVQHCSAQPAEVGTTEFCVLPTQELGLAKTEEFAQDHGSLAGSHQWWPAVLDYHAPAPHRNWRTSNRVAASWKVPKWRWPSKENGQRSSLQKGAEKSQHIHFVGHLPVLKATGILRI